MRGPRPMKPLDRFRMKIAKTPDGCWLWIGKTLPNGYGQFAVKQAPGAWGHVFAHRFAYETFVGPIPSGLIIDHLCRVRNCVNPAHLEPVTYSQNSLRGNNVNRAKTHCKNGHAFSQDNTRYEPRAHGRLSSRRCLVCQREYDRRRRSKRRIREGMPA